MQYLKEGQEVIGLFFEGKVVSVDIPKKVKLEVASVEEAVRGDTASGTATKEAILETGATIQVPLFIKQGERIVVNTENGQYVERAS
jgi:elongation factor P